ISSGKHKPELHPVHPAALEPRQRRRERASRSDQQAPESSRRGASANHGASMSGVGADEDWPQPSRHGRRPYGGRPSTHGPRLHESATRELAAHLAVLHYLLPGSLGTTADSDEIVPRIGDPSGYYG